MRQALLFTILISILIIGITTSAEVAKTGTTEAAIPSIYREDGRILFFLDPDSSFYKPYSFTGASPGFILRKIGHFFVYGCIAGVIFLLLPIAPLYLRGLLAFTSASLIGLVDEVHQHFLLNRSGRILDVYVNMIGSLGFVVLLMSASMTLKWVKELKSRRAARKP